MSNVKNIKLLYDNKEKKFQTLYAKVNGKSIKIEGNGAIVKFLNQYKEDEKVSSLNDLKRSKQPKSKKMYKEITGANKEVEYIPAPSVAEWTTQQENTYRIANSKLNRTSPFTGKKASNISLSKKVRTSLAVASVAAVVGIAGLIGCGNKKEVKEEDSTLDAGVNTEIELEKEVQEKVNPTTWEEYMTSKYNENAVQKSFAKKVMENLIENNIKTKTINEKEITYGLTPDQAMAFSAYYNSTTLSNDDLLAIFGDYKFTGNSDVSKDITTLANDAIMTIEFSWAIADKEEDMIIPVVEDEIVQELIVKYKDLCLEYKTASTEKAKQDAKKKIETELNDDFINNNNGVINLYDHPSAQIILNTVPGVFSLVGNPLDEKLNEVLVGTEAQNEVATDGGEINGKAVDKKAETIIESRGLVDTSCSVYIRRFDDFEDYRTELKSVKTIMDKTDAKEESEYDLITKDSYEYDNHDEHEGVIIPIMTDYVVRTYGLENANLDTLLEDMMQEVIQSIQDDKINNPGEFNPTTNPAGGKKGDTYSQTQNGVTVNGSTLNANDKAQAENEANKKAGTVSDAEGKNQATEIQSILDQIGSQKEALLQHYINNGAGASEYNASWANSKYDAVRNYYNTIKQAGIDTYNEIQKQSGQTTEGADNTPSHVENPNQPQEQPQQPSSGGSTDEIEGGYTGEVTTDGSGVWNPEDYGEVQSYSYEQAINTMSDYDLTALCEAAGLNMSSEETIDAGLTR